MLENEKPELAYNPEATIIINKSGSYYSSVEPEEKTARDISGTYRMYDQIVQRESRKIANLDKVKEYLIENYDDLELHADEIASILEIELTQEVEFEMTVTITGTITLPVGKDFNDLSTYDFDVELSCNESDYEIENYDVEIERLRES